MIARNNDERSQNESLRREFEASGLDVDQVLEPTPEDPALENCRLRSLYAWVSAYRECPSRRDMERRGFDFPPVDPDVDPDTDWMRFERWMQGKPLTWRFTEEHGPLKASEDMTDAEVLDTLKRVKSVLAGRGVVVDLKEEVPPRLAYKYLRKELEGDFEFLAPGTSCHLDGCSGYCPGCFQRPWCDFGNDELWDEDKEAGRIVLPPETRAFVGEDG